MTQSGYNINDLVREAQNRWLKPAEVLFILQNYEEEQLTHEPPQRPPTSGSLFLYNKRVLRFFRRDGHIWRKKKDGKAVGEAHERLKVGNVEALNCYYAHGEKNSNFQRRSYWMLDPAYEHIVLVHYREISEGRQGSGSSSLLSSGSSVTFSESPTSYTAQYPGSSAIISELYESNQSLSSPRSVEVSSDAVIESNGMDPALGMERTAQIGSSSELEVSQALRRLEEQLGLNGETVEEEIGPLYYNNQNPIDSEYAWKDQSGTVTSLDGANDFVLQQGSGGNAKYHHQAFAQELTTERKDSVCWKEMLEFSKSSLDVKSQENLLLTSNENGKQLPLTRSRPVEKQGKHQWINFNGPTSQNHDDISSASPNNLMNPHYSVCGQIPSSFDSNRALPTSISLCQEVENFELPAYSLAVNSSQTAPDCYSIFDQGQMMMHLEADSCLSIAQKQKFTIREVSPEWGYVSEATKVVIIGSFLCDPSECAWTCMFGDTEVPVQVIQDGVICCLAPPLGPGKVTLSITSGNQESCSEVRKFEYRSKPSNCAHCSSEEASKSPEELLLLVRFVQMLLSDPLMQKGDRDSSESGIDLLGKLKVAEDSWGHVIEALLVGSWTSSSTMDWLLQELLKDKLQQWLSSRSQGHVQFSFSLSKKEQGMIHIVAGLGFEWALNPILNSGVSIDFRDINGWTALHWAARFGREKMVAALIASGASAGAVTDPNSQDPTGKTPATIAAASGHKGLAGYLSEIELTSHLSSLKLEENDLSKSSADVEAEITVNSILQRSLTTNGDHLSLKNSLAAVRNAAQAAARIQAAFRAHSFRQRQQREAASSIDEYGILSNDIEGLLAASKLAFGNARNHDTAALSIQKKYRGWKGRKDFLTFRQKVIKIQAHVRGHQVRKQYKVICWAVGILEKVVLRWRRKGAGLRGYRHESDCIDESEDEDVLKVFRKQKVDGAVKEAFSRVLSMVEYPEARQQYCRMLESYHQAKAELEDTESEVTSSLADISFGEIDDPFLLM